MLEEPLRVEAVAVRNNGHYEHELRIRFQETTDVYIVGIYRTGSTNALRWVSVPNHAPKFSNRFKRKHHVSPWKNADYSLEERLEAAARAVRSDYIKDRREEQERQAMIGRVQCKVQPGPCIERLEQENRRLRLEAGEQL